jgi:hypothetical protein
MCLLPVIYAGSYWALLDEIEFEVYPASIDAAASNPDEGMVLTPRYKIDHPAIRAFYRPATWLDQSIRPQLWRL